MAMRTGAFVRVDLNLLAVHAGRNAGIVAAVGELVDLVVLYSEVPARLALDETGRRLPVWVRHAVFWQC